MGESGVIVRMAHRTNSSRYKQVANFPGTSMLNPTPYCKRQPSKRVRQHFKKLDRAESNPSNAVPLEV